MKKEFLGRGWKFPVKLGVNGAFELSEEYEDIKEAILIVLKTAKGERVMEPEFGCGIHTYVFEIINAVTMTRMREEIRKALLLYEPRIEVINIESEYQEEAILTFDIEYRVLNSNSRYNLVYPYHMNEGR